MFTNARARSLALVTLVCLCVPAQAHASMFHGETLDKVADALTWIVLIVAPVVGIGVFWIVHILPEKIAEKRHHPQAQAIQTLCLLSLFFGGVLWPLAWLWAYSKPVLYKLAYGTDKVVHGEEDAGHATPAEDREEEMRRLRKRLSELEGRAPGTRTTDGGVA